MEIITVLRQSKKTRKMYPEHYELRTKKGIWIFKTKKEAKEWATKNKIK